MFWIAAKPFKPSLLFVGKARSSTLKLLHSGKLLASPA
jgi:hypothetical protein